MHETPPFDPAAQDSIALVRVPVGTRLGIWLLWLCFSLPASMLLFLGGPGLLALFAMVMLQRANVPLEVWSELEPWIALLVLTAGVNGRASFTHRRVLAGDNVGVGVGTRWWLMLGGVACVVWLGLFQLERIPRTELNPVLHYWALSGVIVWSSLTLAWWTGRAASLVIAPIERRALRSGVMRGSLATAGPLSLLGIVAVGGAIFGVDVGDAVDDSRALVEGSFKDDWSVKALGPAGGGSSGATAGSQRLERAGWFHACIEQIYRGRPSMFQVAVGRIASFGIDAESVATDAAIKVCSRPEKPRELRPYYIRSVQNGAKSDRARRLRYECSLPDFDDRGAPNTEADDDCIRRQLCGLPDADQEVLINLLDGKTTSEFADDHGLSTSAAEKRLSRAKLRLDGALRRECFN